MKIICTSPRELIRESLNLLILIFDSEGYTEQKLNIAISEWINEKIAVDTITLIRRYVIVSTLISHEYRIRRAVDNLKKAHNFTKYGLGCICLKEEYLMHETVLKIKVFEED